MYVIMGEVEFLFLSMLSSLLGILFVMLSSSGSRQVAVLSTVFVNAAITSFLAVGALVGHTFELSFSGIQFMGTIPIRIDALSAWFILIINFTCINGVLYGIGYLKPYESQKSNIKLHWILFLVFHSSMIWVCILQHSIAFLIAWELMSVSSMLLVIFEYQEKNTLKAGLNYLVQMHIGVVLITMGFIWVYVYTGSFWFDSISVFFLHNSNIWLFLLFFTGFGIKAGFIPLHTWLPQAHPAAPSHISGIMSGVIVKLGIYGIFRVISLLKADYFLLGEIVLMLSILTALFGVVNSAIHRNFKKMLAYCTIENIGIIGMGIGLGLIGTGLNNVALVMAGYGGALLHTLNHSLFKSLLFFGAGSIYQQTHTKSMEKLGGLIRNMPQTALLFLCGSLAICGLPPFNGFVSEFLIYSGFLSGIKGGGLHHSALMISAIAGLALVGGISLLAFTKTFGTIFLGSRRTNFRHEPVEVSFLMLLPQYFIIAVMVSVSLYPQFYIHAISGIIRNFYSSGSITVAFEPSYINIMAGIGRYSAMFILLITGLILTRRYFVKKMPVEVGSTWGCGYVAPTARIQYTGKSFSKSLAKLLNFSISEKKKYTEITPGEIFPKQRAYSSYYIDKFGSNINQLTDRLIYGLNYFQFMQNGNMQMYILYGLVFIIVVFLGTLLNFF